jgi:hypothetical protein
VGETEVRRPTPIYWHPPQSIPHGPLQLWFYEHTGSDPALAEARQERQTAIDEPLAPIAVSPSPGIRDWNAAVREAAAAYGAEDCGITAMRTEAEAIRLLKAAGRQPVDACMRMIGGGSNTLRISLKQRTAGEAKQAIHSLFGAIMRLKHIYVFDEDIDIDFGVTLILTL